MTSLTREGLMLLVREIDEMGEGLSPWEVDFIAGIIDKPPASFSTKQIGSIQQIHAQRVCGEVHER